MTKKQKLQAGAGAALISVAGLVTYFLVAEPMCIFDPIGTTNATNAPCYATMVAVATDNRGARTTSAPVTIHFVPAPSPTPTSTPTPAPTSTPTPEPTPSPTPPPTTLHKVTWPTTEGGEDAAVASQWAQGYRLKRNLSGAFAEFEYAGMASTVKTRKVAWPKTEGAQDLVIKTQWTEGFRFRRNLTGAYAEFEYVTNNGSGVR